MTVHEWLGLLVGVVALLTALVVFRTTVLSGRATRDKVAEVHVLVNSRVETLTARVDQLEAAITARGGTVPDPPE